MNEGELVAEAQYGLITRAQALAEGLSDSAITRRVAAGRWITVYPGVFRIAGAPVTRRQRAMAATLWTGGSMSHGSAGGLLRLEGVRSEALHLTVPYGCTMKHDVLTIHRSTALPDIDRRIVDRIWCTSATRTLPKPVRQHPVAGYRLDFAWPWLWVAAECDGFERHGTRLAWKRGRARIAAIEQAGWRIVHFTWDDITAAPARSVERVALALRAAA